MTSGAHDSIVFKGVADLEKGLDLNECTGPLFDDPASNCSACLADLVRGGTTIPPTALPDFAATVVSSEPHCGCGPQDLEWDNNGTYGATGEWDESCNCPLGSLDGCTGCDNYQCQLGPSRESGMGANHADGLPTPTGILFSILRTAQGSRQLKLSGVASLEAKGVYPMAWQGKKRIAELILSNPSSNVIHGLPAVKALMPSAIRVLRAIRLSQKNESSEVGPLEGFHSTARLVGTISAAARFKGPASKKLGRLQPYQVVKLWVSFAGCAY